MRRWARALLRARVPIPSALDLGKDRHARGLCGCVRGRALLPNTDGVRVVGGWQYGPVKNVTLVYDSLTQKPRGYGFIEFEHERDMKNAYKHADGRKIDNRRVLVDVERGRTVKDWKPRRLGSGLGSSRKDRAKQTKMEKKEKKRKEALQAKAAARAAKEAAERAALPPPALPPPARAGDDRGLSRRDDRDRGSNRDSRGSGDTRGGGGGGGDYRGSDRRRDDSRY